MLIRKGGEYPFCSLYRLTADKKEIKDFPKLPSTTSFIRKTLSAVHDLKIPELSTK